MQATTQTQAQIRRQAHLERAQIRRQAYLERVEVRKQRLEIQQFNSFIRYKRRETSLRGGRGRGRGRGGCYPSYTKFQESTGSEETELEAKLFESLYEFRKGEYVSQIPIQITKKVADEIVLSEVLSMQNIWVVKLILKESLKFWDHVKPTPESQEVVVFPSWEEQSKLSLKALYENKYFSSFEKIELLKVLEEMGVDLFQKVDERMMNLLFLSSRDGDFDILYELLKNKKCPCLISINPMTGYNIFHNICLLPESKTHINVKEGEEEEEEVQQQQQQQQNHQKSQSWRKIQPKLKNLLDLIFKKNRWFFLQCTQNGFMGSQLLLISKNWKLFHFILSSYLNPTTFSTFLGMKGLYHHYSISPSTLFLLVKGGHVELFFVFLDMLITGQFISSNLSFHLTNSCKSIRNQIISRLTSPKYNQKTFEFFKMYPYLFHVSCLSGNLEMVKTIFILSGININLPLTMDFFISFPETIEDDSIYWKKSFVEIFENIIPLHCGCLSGDLKVIEFLLEMGSDKKKISNYKAFLREQIETNSETSEECNIEWFVRRSFRTNHNVMEFIEKYGENKNDKGQIELKRKKDQRTEEEEEKEEEEEIEETLICERELCPCRECPVCMETIGIEENSQRVRLVGEDQLDSIETSLITFSKKCGHRFCSECICNWFAESSMEGNLGISKLKCLCCSSFISSERALKGLKLHVKQSSSLNESKRERWSKLIDRFEETTLFNSLKKQKDFKWCPECKNFGGWIESDNYEVYCCCECLKCSYVFCPKCGLEAHNEIVGENGVMVSCKEFENKVWRRKHIDIIETKQLIIWKKDKTKKCPKCFIDIEKNGGCRHMRCRQCNIDFCWECLKVMGGNGPDNCKC